MKKKKIGIIASAIATSAICASMIAGSTFALFTSNDSVNMTVTAGNVSVEWDVPEAKVWRGVNVDAADKAESYEETAEASAKFDKANKKLTVDNVIAGDKIAFTLSVNNTGSVTASYQYSVNVTSGFALAQNLTWTIGGGSDVKDTKALTSYTSAWKQNLAAKTGKDTYSVEILVGGNVQNATANIELGVTAVQGNAKVDTEKTVLNTIPENATVYEVAAPEKFVEALSAENAYVALAEDITFTQSTNVQSVTQDTHINLNGKKLTTNLSFEISNGASLVVKNGKWDATALRGKNQAFKAIGDAAGVELTLDGVDLVTTYYGVAMENHVQLLSKEEEQPVITVKNSVFTSVDPFGAAFATNATVGNANNGHGSDEWTGKPLYTGGKATLENCVINAATGITITAPVSLEVKNCTINSKLQSVVVRGGTVKLVGCTLINKGYTETGLKEMLEDGHGFKFINKCYNVGAVGVQTADEWQNANDVNLAAIVVGSNNTGNSYKYTASLELVDTTVTADENTPDGKVYVCARESFDVTLNHSGCNLTAEDITTAGSIENVIVNG